VLLAACPGGATSNLVNYLLNSNLALSVSITTVNSFITQFTIPIFVNLALMAFMNEDKNIDLPFWGTLLQILIITVIPAVIGIYIRRYKARFADKVRQYLKYIMTALLAVAMIGAIFIEKNENIKIPVNDYWRVIPLTMLLNFGSMFIANYLARYFKLDAQSRITISVEVGLQNTGLAIAVATGSNMLNNPAIAIPAALYALFSFFTTAGFGYFVRRRNRDQFTV
jgi:bile acid:Na+ symporter, BASS family